MAPTRRRDMSSPLVLRSSWFTILLSLICSWCITGKNDKLKLQFYVICLFLILTMLPSTFWISAHECNEDLEHKNPYIDKILHNLYTQTTRTSGNPYIDKMLHNLGQWGDISNQSKMPVLLLIHSDDNWWRKTSELPFSLLLLSPFCFFLLMVVLLFLK